MSKLLLHYLDRVSSLDGIDGVAMAEIVEPDIRQTNGSDNFLEMVVHGAVLDVVPQVVSKNEVAVIVP